MIGDVIKYEQDNIDTDVIIPGTYLKIHDYNELATHAMEGLDPDFPSKNSKSGGEEYPLPPDIISILSIFAKESILII